MFAMEGEYFHKHSLFYDCFGYRTDFSSEWIDCIVQTSQESPWTILIGVAW